jgi:hypothetical protein
MTAEMRGKTSSKEGWEDRETNARTGPNFFDYRQTSLNGSGDMAV